MLHSVLVAAKILGSVTGTLTEYELLERIDRGRQLLLPPGTAHPQLPSDSENPEYIRRGFAGKGANGEVWRARAKNGPHKDVVLKRIYGERENALETAGREIFYGQKFSDALPHVSRFLKFFTDADSMWLVFVDEGLSLYGLLFTVDPSSGMMQRSRLWKFLRENPDAIIEVFRQTIDALDSAHRLGVVHRDVKLENIFVRQTKTGIVVRLGDWGSAYSSEASSLYPRGPSEDEETARVSPPEKIELPSEIRDKAFDIFTVGIMFLELFLGRLDLLELPAGLEEGSVGRYRVLCIIPWCRDDEFRRRIEGLDPLGIGIQDENLIKLVRSMILAEASDRPSTREILENVIFRRSSAPLALVLSPDPEADTCPLVVVKSAMNQGARTSMEDRIVEVVDGADVLACVLDGHNGPVTVDFATNHLRKSFHRLREFALLQTMKRVYAEIVMQTEELISGSTGTCVARIGRCIVVGHIGDTRALSIQEVSESQWKPAPGGMTSRGNMILDVFGDVAKVETVTGRVTYERNAGPPGNSRHFRVEQITRDHKPGDVVEKERIEKLGGSVEDDRVNGLAISRGFGALLAKPQVSSEPEVFELSEFPAAVAICSDGVFDILDNQRVGELAMISPEVIISAALKRGARDNLACVVVISEG